MTFVLAIAALALALLAAALALLLGADRTFEARLDTRLAPQPSQAAALRPLFAGLRPELSRLLMIWGERAGRGGLEAGARTALRSRLVQAGFYGQRTAEAFFGIRAAAAAVIGGLALAGAVITGAGLLATLFVIMAGANLGLFAPNVWLRRRIAERREAMAQGLPDAIDLMVVSVEAGATVSAALQRVVAEFDELHPVLCEQFGMMLMEMQAGASRAEALKRLAQRIDSDEVRGLTTLLIQSEAVGASLGATLRTVAIETRKTRYLDAERKAAELPVKMAFPLVLCIFPCLTAVIFIPVGIMLVRSVFAN